MCILPSDTKLLLTNNYFEMIIFEKLRISRVISGKSLSFLEILRVQIPSKITKNNSQGNYFRNNFVSDGRCIVKTSDFTRGVCKNRGFY